VPAVGLVADLACLFVVVRTAAAATAPSVFFFEIAAAKADSVAALLVRAFVALSRALAAGRQAGSVPSSFCFSRHQMRSVELPARPPPERNYCSPHLHKWQQPERRQT
jgi:hypothetical protein